MESGVARSSVEDEPAEAAGLFGDQIDLARAYTGDLVVWGEELGLLGPLEYPRIWSRHIVNCVLVAPLLRTQRVGDIGSGAGLPGLVLAIARPDVHFVLIEPMERRADWLRREASHLGLGNVEVVRARAQDVQGDLALDQVTARAVTALAKLIAIAAPLLKPGGEMIFMKGERVDGEVLAARDSIRRYKLSAVEILLLGGGIGGEPTRVFRATVD